jgi:hypothetical protein
MVVRKPRSSGDKLVIFSGRYSLISRGAGQLMSRPYSLTRYTVDPYSLKIELAFNLGGGAACLYVVIYI